MIAAPIARRGLFSSLFFVAAGRNPLVFLKKMGLEAKYMSETFNEQIAPEIAQAITREAVARGLSVND
jgi:predicted HicB family RNase H-like nuclease